MKRSGLKFCFVGTFGLSLLLCPLVTASAQVEVIKGIERIQQASQAREKRSAQALQKQQQQLQTEQQALNQREQIKNSPGSYPRSRESDEARLNNNPWAREARKKSGAAEVRVEIFVTENCKACDQVETYLNEVAVPYAIYYLAPGTEAEEKYLAQIGRGEIPAIRVNNKVIRGYRPEELRQLILAER